MEGELKINTTYWYLNPQRTLFFSSSFLTEHFCALEQTAFGKKQNLKVVGWAAEWEEVVI